jgi:hypothetical protein
MEDWREREAHNEARFREQNEWIEVTGASYGASEPLIVFICECGDANCTQPIELTIGEYESVRGVSNRFAVAPNHENPESEVIISENARFTVVDKITAPGLRIARETDPRAEPLPHAPLPDAPLPDDTPSAAATVTVIHQAADRRSVAQRAAPRARVGGLTSQARAPCREWHRSPEPSKSPASASCSRCTPPPRTARSRRSPDDQTLLRERTWHVRPRGRSWAVLRQDAVCADSLHEMKAAAIARGVDLARRARGYVRNKAISGRLEEERDLTETHHA